MVRFAGVTESIISSFNEFCIDVFSAKKEERGAYKYTIKRPLEASRDEFAEALKEAFDFYK